MVNLVDATQWLTNRETIEIKDKTFVKCGFGRRIYLWLDPKEKEQQIQKIADCIWAHVVSQAEPGVCQQLATAFITCYKNDRQASKIIKTFERQVAQNFPEATYLHSQNKTAYQKWIKNGNDPLIFKAS